MSLALARTTFEWTENEENVLIQSVRESSTVRDGIQKASETLGTTFYICRNHWYKVILPRNASNDNRESVNDIRDSLESLIGSLSRLVDDNNRLAREVAKLREENDSLTQENKELNTTHEVILNIMEKARKLCLLSEEKTPYVIEDGVVSFQKKG